LRIIEDLDVKLGSTTMVIEHQDSSLVQIVVFSKTRPAALEEYITLAVIIYFYLVQRSVAGHLSQNSFMLLFMALAPAKAKKQNKLHAYDCDRGGCAKLMSRSLAVPAVAAEILGLFLLPNGRPCRCLAGVDDEASAAEALGLFFCFLEGGRDRASPPLCHRPD
jgi:hypothetical protein